MLLRTIIVDEIRILTFRRPTGPIAEHWRAYLAFGLFFTWLAGVGRYWDNPRALLIQHLGLGSIVYVFVLAGVLWLLLLPLRPSNWSYRGVLTFVTLTSPPAVLYAIPVERFLSLPTAQAVNAWFLAVVAAWRVALLVVYLRRVGNLRGFTLFVAPLLPLVLIVFTLAILNLEHIVFNLMSGIRPENASPNDLAYQVVGFLAALSYFAAPVLLLLYLGIVYFRRRKAPG